MNEFSLFFSWFFLVFPGFSWFFLVFQNDLSRQTKVGLCQDVADDKIVADARLGNQPKVSLWVVQETLTPNTQHPRVIVSKDYDSVIIVG